jgi:hypothetical protein
MDCLQRAEQKPAADGADDPRSAGREARQFERTLYRLGAAVADERELQVAGRDLGQRASQSRDRLAGVDVAQGMRQALGLAVRKRQDRMRRYFDERLQQEMLLRAVVEETAEERVVTTVYITSKIGKYMKRVQP